MTHKQQFSTLRCPPACRPKERSFKPWVGSRQVGQRLISTQPGATPQRSAKQALEVGQVPGIDHVLAFERLQELVEDELALLATLELVLGQVGREDLLLFLTTGAGHRVGH